MSKPIVAVVGRPNVGKSTLFNKLCGQRLAIVEDTPGITRDRIFANCEWSGHEFMLVDTGGIEPKATEGILAHMREQAEIAIDTADCIIMVVDVRDGLTAADEEVAHMLRRSHKPIILAVNKCDKRGLHGVKLRPERRRKGIERRAEVKPEVAFLLHSGAYAVVGIDKAPRKAGQLLKFHRWYRKPCAAGRAG